MTILYVTSPHCLSVKLVFLNFSNGRRARKNTSDVLICCFYLGFTKAACIPWSPAVFLPCRSGPAPCFLSSAPILLRLVPFHRWTWPGGSPVGSVSPPTVGEGRAPLVGSCLTSCFPVNSFDLHISHSACHFVCPSCVDTDLMKVLCC